MNKFILAAILILTGTASAGVSAYDTDGDGICDGPDTVENPACQSTVCVADLDTVWQLTCEYYDGDSGSCSSLGFCSYSGGQCDYSPVSCESYNGDEPGCSAQLQCLWLQPDQCVSNREVACGIWGETACGLVSDSCEWDIDHCSYRGSSFLTDECVATDADACALLDFCAINPDCVPLCEAGPDNCPSVANPDQADSDGDGIGDACDIEESAGPTVPVGLNFEVSDSTSGGVSGKPAIDYDGANFMVVWLDDANTVRAARVTPAGEVLDTPGSALGPGDQSPSIAFNGTDYLVVWVEGTQIHGAKLGADASVAPGSPFVIAATANAKSRMISLAFDGTNYLVTWRTNSDQIRAMRVTTAGVNLDDPAGFVVGTGFYPWVAFDGTNYMIVWHKWGNGLDIWANRVSTAGAALDGSGFAVSGATGDQDHASIAFGNGVYLVTWNDTRGATGDTSGNGHDVRSARVNTAGTVLDTTAIIVADRARAQVPPNTQFDGTDFLVVWQVDLQPVDHRAVDVYGRRVSSGGEVLDVQGIPVSTAFHNQFGPRVGYGDGKHLVVWTHEGPCEYCMWGQLLEKGAIIPGASPSPAPGDPSPAVTSPAPVAVAWTTEAQPTTEPLQTILGVDGDDVFAGGSPAPLYHWNGSSWASISYPAPNGIYDIWSAAAPDDLWIAGWCYHVSRYDGEQIINPSCLNWPEPGLGLGIWRLEDSGVTLTVGALADAKYYDGPIDYYDGEPPTYWWPAGDWAGWDPVPQATNIDLHGLWATAAEQAYAVGEFGTVLQWNGAEWLAVPGVPTVQTLNAIWGPGDVGFFVVGDFGTILHYDGAGWTTHSSGTTEHLLGVAGVSGSEVYAVGLGGTILRYDGASWTPETSGTDKMLTSVTRAGDKMIAVGDGGVVRSRPVTPYAASSDLAISKTASTEAAVAGDTVSFEVTVSNLTSGAGLVAATVTDTPPGTLSCTWTCASSGRATCRRGPWDGNLVDKIELPESATAQYTGECVIDQAATDIISNTATVAAATGITDPVPGNNSASDGIEIRPAYTVGGTVGGLAGSGLVLQNNAGDDLAISGNGEFTFTTPVIDGGSYSVSVHTQPASLSQTCSVTNGSGTIPGANVTDVSVTCVTNTFTVGGTVSFLDGTGLVLQNNAGDDLAIGANGGFVFSTPLTDGNGYDVTVLTQPSNLSQTCTTSNAIGTLAGSNVTDVEVSCQTDNFTIGGDVSGLDSGNELVLHSNGGDDLLVDSNGPFTFPTAMTDGSFYVVSVLTQPTNPNQFCHLENRSGTLAGANVTDVMVTCVPACNTKTVSVVSVDSGASFEACEILALGPTVVVSSGADLSVSSGWEIQFIPEFLIETGATLTARVCGQSLCMTSPDPMPYGCHPCVNQICDVAPSCCDVEFDQSCLDKVGTICSLACE